MALIEPGGILTSREIQQMEYEERLYDKQVQYNLEVKKLELEIAKLEAKWSSWLRIPITIIKLPVFFLFGLGFIVSSALKIEPSENFWRFIGK